MNEVPDPEVSERARRWTYTAKFKREVLAEDEGRYLCSESAMCRLLRQTHGQVRERRPQAVHPQRVTPELVAQAPKRV